MIPRLSLSERIPQVVQGFLAELRQSKFSGKINHDYATRLLLQPITAYIRFYRKQLFPQKI
ncbi:MAG: hypothetical protein Ct9H300mP28_09500 [Pseudomonadota bacterium]|nr:MAG: hypothetical protein Ct9H300mP28_09500 [Pseudomonadota bacterium]